MWKTSEKLKIEENGILQVQLDLIHGFNLKIVIFIVKAI